MYFLQKLKVQSSRKTINQIKLVLQLKDRLPGSKGFKNCFLRKRKWQSVNNFSKRQVALKLNRQTRVRLKALQNQKQVTWKLSRCSPSLASRRRSPKFRLKKWSKISQMQWQNSSKTKKHGKIFMPNNLMTLNRINHNSKISIMALSSILRQHKFRQALLVCRNLFELSHL